jgi:hypothetical protein
MFFFFFFAQLVLLLGNFLNGNTYRGGAFGIKIASINKVVYVDKYQYMTDTNY